MAEDRQATPEKQLLKLIEESKGSAGAKKDAKRKGLGLLSLGSLRGALLGRLSFFKRTAKNKVHTATAKTSFNISSMNRYLTGAVVVLLLYVVTDTMAQTIHLNQVPDFQVKKDQNTEFPSENITPLYELDFYLGKVNSRNIFKEGKAPTETAVKKVLASAESNEVIKKFSLVGIAWSANPDVILEDKTKKRTYFAKKGQVIGEGIKVEAILKDKVVLSFEGKEFELK